MVRFRAAGILCPVQLAPATSAWFHYYRSWYTLLEIYWLAYAFCMAVTGGLCRIMRVCYIKKFSHGCVQAGFFGLCYYLRSILTLLALEAGWNICSV